MSLLQEYQKNWLNIKDDVYFVIDNTILKYGLKLGYSDNDIKQEILKNSPQLKNMPKEYTINYLSKLQGNNLNLNQKDTSIPNDSFNYKKACNSLSEAFINFYAKKEISVANKLLDKNYPNLDIQNVIKNHSPFFSDFKNILPNTSHVNYVNAIMNKFPTQLTNLQYKDHLNIYLKLAKIEQAKNNNVFNSYVDFKLVLTLYFDKNIPMNSIKKIFSEATLNKNIKQPNYGEYIFNSLNKIIDKYKLINNFKKKLDNNSSIDEHYLTYVKQYLYYQNKKYLNGKDEQQIIKRLFAAKFNDKDIKTVLYNNSPVALEPGRNAKNYIEHNITYVQKDYTERVLKAKEHFNNVSKWFSEERKNIDELIKKDNLKNKKMPDIFYYGLLAKKLLEKGAYPQYIVKCFEGEIPSLKAKQSENDNYIYAIVDGAQKATYAQKAILSYISPYKFPEMELSEIKAKNIPLAEVFKSVIKERIDIYPNTTLNLSKSFIDKDACVKLLNRYPDITQNELIEAVNSASVYNQLPGVDRDYSLKIVQEAIDKYNEANLFIENEREQQENLKNDFLLYKAVNLGDLDIEENHIEEQQKEYCDCKAAITMINKKVSEVDIKNILADESTEKDLSDKYKYADYIFEHAKKVIAREIQILNHLPIKKDAENIYKQYMKDDYLKKQYFSPEADINAAKKMLNDNISEQDISIVITKHSPIAAEPKRNMPYISYILKKAKLDLELEKEKLRNYQPRIRQETNITDAYKHHMDDFTSIIDLPYSKIADELIAKAMLIQKFSQSEVEKTLTEMSPLSAPTPSNLLNNTYGKEVFKNLKNNKRDITQENTLIRSREREYFKDKEC